MNSVLRRACTLALLPIVAHACLRFNATIDPDDTLTWFSGDDGNNNGILSVADRDIICQSVNLPSKSFDDTGSKLWEVSCDSDQEDAALNVVRRSDDLSIIRIGYSYSNPRATDDGKLFRDGSSTFRYIFGGKSTDGKTFNGDFACQSC